MAETKTDAKTDEKTTAKTAFTWAKYDEVVKKFQQAPTPEEQATILAADPETVEKGVRLMRKLERKGMPLYFQVTERLQENTVVDKLRAARDLATAYRAVRDVYDGAKWVYQYFKAP